MNRRYQDQNGGHTEERDQGRSNGSSKGPWAKVTFPAGQGAQIVACIWANDVRKGDQSFISYSVTVERRYNDNGEWKSATGFRPNDLLTASYALQKAYDIILEERNQR